jgi:hypothetical protein
LAMANLGFIRLADCVHFHGQSLRKILCRFSAHVWLFGKVSFSFSRRSCTAGVLVGCNFSVLAKVFVVRTIWSRWVRCSFSIRKAGIRCVRLTMRAADLGYAARFLAFFLAPSWFRQIGVISSHPKRLTQCR